MPPNEYVRRVNETSNLPTKRSPNAANNYNSLGIFLSFQSKSKFSSRYVSKTNITLQSFSIGLFGLFTTYVLA